MSKRNQSKRGSKKSRIWALVSITLFIAIVASSIVGYYYFKEKEPIRIGLVAPLSGFLSEEGEAIRIGGEIAVSDLNKQGGINGRTVSFIPADGECSRLGGRTAAERLIHEEKVDVIIGDMCSDGTIGIAAVAEPEGVITISYQSTSPAISELGDYIFRTIPSDAQNAQIMADYALSKHETFAVIYEKTTFAEDFAKLFISEIEENNAAVVRTVALPENFNEPTTQLASLQDLSFDALVVSAQTGVGASILINELRSNGIHVPVYGSDVLAFEQLGDLLTVPKNDLYGISAIDLPEEGIDAEADEFRAQFRQRSFKDDVPTFAVGTYDAVMIAAEAFRNVGTDADAVKQFLYEMPVYTGVLGDYAFDSKGDVSLRKNIIKIYDETRGTFIPLR